MTEAQDATPTATDEAAGVLAPLPEVGIRRVLCVVAHPDDLEYGASAAVATWTRRGIEVTYLLLTAGEAGMADAPEVVAPLRETEQRAACTVVGVEDLRILGLPDGMLEYGLGLRRAVAQVIRQVRPDLVLTANFEVEAYGGLNQADHRAAGLATVDAVCDAANPWVFRDLEEEAWQARAPLVAGTESPTHAVIVDADAVEAAVASLASHRAYLEHIGNHPAPEEFIPAILRGGGQAAGSEHAVVLRVYELAGLGGGGADAGE